MTNSGGYKSKAHAHGVRRFPRRHRRLSTYKALPTDEELEASEWTCGGEYIFRLRAEEPDDYAKLVNARAKPWGAEPTLRMERCVEHFCSLLVVTAQRGKGDNTILLEKEVENFIPLMG